LRWFASGATRPVDHAWRSTGPRAGTEDVGLTAGGTPPHGRGRGERPDCKICVVWRDHPTVFHHDDALRGPRVDALRRRVFMLEIAYLTIAGLS
jgi:hypothetical protein